ncbi:ESM1 protein, partial [Polypterus senegalus]
MQLCFILLVLTRLLEVDAWSVGLKYAVDCPERCDEKVCGGVQRCKRTVLDDCGCCRVCAAARGEHCYRTVSGMDGVKCGPGLRCHFYKEEDDFGEEYGICKDCPYGTYGVECRKTCNCKTGICDRETGKCMKFPFYSIAPSKMDNRHKLRPQTENEMGSGDAHSDVKEDLLKEKNMQTATIKRLNPR